MEIVRKYKKDGAKYFGPYLSGFALRESITAVREHFPIRQCKKDIRKAIARGERPCLMYHIGKCCAPCTGKVTPEEYRLLLDQVTALFQGNCKTYIDDLTAKMMAESEKLNFEKAAQYRDRMRAMQSISEKQIASSASDNSYDVFALARNELETVVYGLFVRAGNVISAESFSINAGDEPFSEIISQFLLQFYVGMANLPKEIIIMDEAEDVENIELLLQKQSGHAVKIHVPRRGEKLKQGQLAKMNAEETIGRHRELTHREWERSEGALTELMQIVGMDVFPHRIECFDNSHIQGRDTVGSMVVFIDGKPDKTLYRRFRTKQNTGGDDYLAMREHLTRRFRRTIDGDEKFAELPDLLIVDGGIGQLNVALEVLNDFGLAYISCIGLAEKNEEIILPDEKESVILARSSPVLQLLQRARDEAHRFAITYHRNLRSKNSLYSVLDNIKGIGDRRKRALYEKFLTIDAIKAADMDELKSADGMNAAAAKSVYDYFHQTTDE